jgi:NAD(P)-dependent dehydrogenase (short-subunit alcohol dehydrogenase family)
MTKLDGRVALVFGAGSIKPGGLSNGKAASITYARAGAKVVAIDLTLEAAEETAASVRAEGHECETFAANVARADDVAAVVTGALAHFGRIDILHNNVGLLEFATFENTSEDQWDRIMAANVKGMFLAAKAVLPHMVAQGGGVITNISALASVRYLGPVVTYMTSKAAVNGFTQSLAIEYARHGVRCNAILPGFIDTPVGLSVYELGDPATVDERKAYRNSKLPGGKPGEAWDIANAALFLASDEARYVNGVLLPVDNGVMLLSPTAA